MRNPTPRDSMVCCEVWVRLGFLGVTSSFFFSSSFFLSSSFLESLVVSSSSSFSFSSSLLGSTFFLSFSLTFLLLLELCGCLPRSALLRLTSSLGASTVTWPLRFRRSVICGCCALAAMATISIMHRHKARMCNFLNIISLVVLLSNFAAKIVYFSRRQYVFSGFCLNKGQQKTTNYANSTKNQS